MNETSSTKSLYYRYRDGYLGGYDIIDGQSFYHRPSPIRLEAFEVIKFTPKGAWIDVYGRRKFILTEAHRRWAHPTIYEAQNSYRARKSRQVKLLTRQLAEAKEWLTCAKADNFELTPDDSFDMIVTRWISFTR